MVKLLNKGSMTNNIWLKGKFRITKLFRKENKDRWELWVSFTNKDKLLFQGPMTSSMELNSRWEDFLPLLWTQFTSVICKDGLLETSANDSVFYPKEPNSASGQELNFTISFYPNMVGNSIIRDYRESFKWASRMDTLITDWIWTWFTLIECPNLLYSGIPIEWMHKERSNNIFWPYQNYKVSRSLASMKRSKLVLMANRTKCISWSNGRCLGEKVAIIIISRTTHSGNFPKPIRKWLKNTTDPYINNVYTLLYLI